MRHQLCYFIALALAQAESPPVSASLTEPNIEGQEQPIYAPAAQDTLPETKPDERANNETAPKDVQVEPQHQSDEAKPEPAPEPPTPIIIDTTSSNPDPIVDSKSEIAAPEAVVDAEAAAIPQEPVVDTEAPSTESVVETPSQEPAVDTDLASSEPADIELSAQKSDVEDPSLESVEDSTDSPEELVDVTAPAAEPVAEAPSPELVLDIPPQEPVVNAPSFSPEPVVDAPAPSSAPINDNASSPAPVVESSSQTSTINGPTPSHEPTVDAHTSASVSSASTKATALETKPEVREVDDSSVIDKAADAKAGSPAAPKSADIQAPGDSKAAAPTGKLKNAAIELVRFPGDIAQGDLDPFYIDGPPPPPGSPEYGPAGGPYAACGHSGYGSRGIPPPPPPPSHGYGPYPPSPPPPGYGPDCGASPDYAHPPPPPGYGPHGSRWQNNRVQKSTSNSAFQDTSYQPDIFAPANQQPNAYPAPQGQRPPQPAPAPGQGQHPQQPNPLYPASPFGQRPFPGPNQQGGQNGQIPGLGGYPQFPQGGFPQGELPLGGLPLGGLPLGELPQGGLPQGGRPQGGLRQGGRPQGGLPQGGLPLGQGVRGDLIPVGSIGQGELGGLLGGLIPGVAGNGQRGGTPGAPNTGAGAPGAGAGTAPGAARGGLSGGQNGLNGGFPAGLGGLQGGLQGGLPGLGAGGLPGENPSLPGAVGGPQNAEFAPEELFHDVVPTHAPLEHAVNHGPQAVEGSAPLKYAQEPIESQEPPVTTPLLLDDGSVQLEFAPGNQYHLEGDGFLTYDWSHENWSITVNGTDTGVALSNGASSMSLGCLAWVIIMNLV